MWQHNKWVSGMNIKLRLRIETPYGEATKIKVSAEGEIVFITSVKVGEKDRWGRYEKEEREFSLDACRIYVEEEEIGE